ncbi:MAG: YgiQ family radical SAM protein [Thermoplasmata archaeon]|nr:YgiQ family radical SAM protein [Thermoplasmata archaeon]
MPISTVGDNFDIILVSAEHWDDHPLSPVGVIARVLDSKGFSVGIIEKPVTEADFIQLGEPNLFFGVTAGSIDSMLNNYTPMKRKRENDPHSHSNKMPDRAIINYCNSLRQYFKGCKIIIGGIEASLRRFAHYDFWDNDLRRSIMYDSRADVLVYGNGELQIVELAEKARAEEPLKGVPGTCIISKKVPSDFTILPSWHEVKEDKKKFCEMQNLFSISSNLAQEYSGNYLLQFAYPKYTEKILDWIYSLDYSRDLHKESLLWMAQFSVVTHRGCIGDCGFCSLSLHQGARIISRTQESILSEIQKITKHRNFKGVIDDLGGPSANMYGMDCADCGGTCVTCGKLDRSHSRLIELMRKARKIPGVKKIFVRSGIRYDLAIDSPAYIEELSRHHISGCLKIAPEHFSEHVLDLMNKNGEKFDEFVEFFGRLNAGTGQGLRYYLMVGHPGEDMVSIDELVKKAKTLGNVDNFQLFTPTPMTLSTCMYWSGMDPRTMVPVKIVYDYRTKKIMKEKMLAIIKDR